MPDTLTEKDHKHIQWIIVGDGLGRNDARKMVKEIYLENTFHFYGQQPVEHISRSYSVLDAKIVSLKNNVLLSITVPSESQSCLASDKPVLALIDSEARRIIDDAKAGYSSAASDYIRLSENVLKLSKLTPKELYMSKNGKILLF